MTQIYYGSQAQRAIVGYHVGSLRDDYFSICANCDRRFESLWLGKTNDRYGKFCSDCLHSLGYRYLQWNVNEWVLSKTEKTLNCRYTCVAMLPSMNITVPRWGRLPERFTFIAIGRREVEVYIKVDIPTVT